MGVGCADALVDIIVAGTMGTLKFSMRDRYNGVFINTGKVFTLVVPIPAPESTLS